MNSFEYNKIFAALLIALITSMVSGIIGNNIVTSPHLAENVYIVANVEEEAVIKSNTNTELPDPDINVIIAAANIDNGQKIAKKCTQCHTLEKGGSHKVGPNLWDVMGKKMAHAPDFAYSQSLLEMANTGIVWDKEKLYLFLKNPRNFIKNTKMAFAGLKSPQERADIIAYLHSLSDAPASL